MEKSGKRFRQSMVKVGNKNQTSALFFVFMNCSFVFQMSQLNDLLIGHVIMAAFAFIGIIFLFIHILKEAVIPLSWFLGTIVLIVIGIVTFLKSGSMTILKLILFFYAVHKVEQEKVLKYFMYSLIIPSVIVSISSFLGIIDLHYVGLKVALRFGMINPNTVPIIVFAIIVSYNLINENNLKYRAIFFEIFVTWLTFVFCRARTAGLVLFSYFFMLLVVKWWGEKRIIRLIFWPFQFFFPVGATITIALTIAFRSYTSFWLTVNNFSSGRLIAWSRYLDKYGISILGNNIELNMGSLDNAYMQLLLKYGVIAFITYLVLFFIISKYAYDKHKMVLFSSIIATEIYCIAEFGPLLINFCPVLIYLACLLVNERGVMYKSKGNEVLEI